MPFDEKVKCEGCLKSGHTWDKCFIRQKAVDEFKKNPQVNAAIKSAEDVEKPGDEESKNW